MSQNAFLAAAVLASTILAGPVPELGSPDNIRALIAAIDSAIADNFPVLGAFHAKDWENVEGLVAMLEDLDILGTVRVKTDPGTPDTVVYTAEVKKVGHALWPSIRAALESALEKGT